MSLLQELLAVKQYQDQRADQEAAVIPNAVNSFLQGRQQAQDNLIKDLTLKATLAKAGLGVDQNNALFRDESLLSPIDQLLQQGQVADAQMKIYQAGGPAPSLFSGTTNPNTYLTPAAPAPAGAIPAPVSAPAANANQIIPKGFDEFGRPTGYEYSKPTAAEDKRNVENQELAGSAQSLIALYKEAKAQRDKVGVPGKELLPEGTAQKVAGKIGKGLASMGADNTDAIDAYTRKMKAFATTVAKAAGEQRPTDEDIQRFIASLPNVDLPDATNERLIAGLMRDLESRGAAVVWVEKTGGGKSPESNGAQTVGKFKVRVK